MAVVATAELEGSSNVSGAWSADLERARARLDEFGKQAGDSLKQPKAGADSALSSINGLAVGAQALAGSAVVAGAISLGTELFEIGGNAQEAKVNLDALTEGQLDKYLNAVTDGADNMISRLDAMTITSKALSTGLDLNAEQMGDLAEASTVLADITGTDTTTAYETLTEAIGRGNTRMLQQMGIVAKGADLQAEINKALKENAGITYTQATQIAAYNMIMQRSNELQEQGVGQTGSASDAQERFNARIENSKTEVGEWLANGLLPWIEGTEAVNQAIDEQSAKLLTTTGSAAEYNKEIAVMNMMAGRAKTAGTMTDQEFSTAKAQLVTDAMERNAAQMREAMMATTDYTTTVDQLNTSFSGVVSSLQQYAAGLEQQASLEMMAVQGAGMLAANQGDMNAAMSVGMDLLKDQGLSAQEMRDAYEAVGLATETVTEAQVKQGQGMQDLVNLAKAGTISWGEYGEAVAQVAAGQEAAAIAAQHQASAVAANEQAQQHGGGVEDIDTGADGMAVDLEEVQAQLAEYQELLAGASGQVTTEFSNNLDAGVLDSAQLYSDLVGDVLAIPGVTTNFSTNAGSDPVTGVVGRLAALIGNIPASKEVNIKVNVESNVPLNYLPQ